MEWLRAWMGAACLLTLAGTGGAKAQCADGTVEKEFRPREVVGCAGAWTEPGVTTDDGTPVEPTCDRMAGNDGTYVTAEDMLEDEVSCSAADLCGLGWALCTDEDGEGVAGTCDSSTTSEPATFVAATLSCAGDFGPDLVGCGTLGCASGFDDALCSIFDRQSGEGENPCAILNQTSCDASGFVVVEEAGWTCPAPAGVAASPVTTVTKTGAEGGGVLCCFREPCDCVDDEGGCHASGDMPEPCSICDGDGEPGAPLSRIPGCTPDAGVEADGGTETADLGSSVPTDPDLGSALPDPGPGVSFRGDGGCECRTASGGAPTFGLLALVLFGWRRRR